MIKITCSGSRSLGFDEMDIKHNWSFTFLNFLELFNDKSNTHEFVNLVKELALPGELTQSRSYDFEFMQVEKPYESYIGANVRLRYEWTLSTVYDTQNRK